MPSQSSDLSDLWNCVKCLIQIQGPFKKKEKEKILTSHWFHRLHQHYSLFFFFFTVRGRSWTPPTHRKPPNESWVKSMKWWTAPVLFTRSKMKSDLSCTWSSRSSPTDGAVGHSFWAMFTTWCSGLFLYSGSSSLSQCASVRSARTHRSTSQKCSGPLYHWLYWECLMAQWWWILWAGDVLITIHC